MKASFLFSNLCEIAFYKVCHPERVRKYIALPVKGLPSDAYEMLRSHRTLPQHDIYAYFLLW
jgi:hypothetical protein